MDQAPHNQVHDLFDQAVELSADQRSEALDKLCGGNTELRKAVESLLRAHDAAGDFLAGSHLAPEQFLQNDVYPPGTRIDRYILLQRIGAGGAGTVYLAEQDPPLRRRVALKVINQEMATARVISHFDLERQTLADMDHPNIAKIFDAGATAEGRPYFVMELVDGKPITRFCSELDLDLRSRLAIFATVCKAVHHAHQKGIVHRDLKPNNILVTVKDGQPSPTVIDFGVAKAMESAEDAEGTHWQFMGTPQYMSPEQTSIQHGKADCRSDVYSLGAALYELLTDSPPFEAQQFAGASYAEISRTIGEVEPPAPSERLTSQARNLPEMHSRSAVLLARAEIVRNLDRIVIKAMSKQPDRRYSSVESLGNDVKGCLDASITKDSDSVHGKTRWRYVIVASLLLLALTAAITFIAQYPSHPEQPAFAMESLAPGLSADLYNGAFYQLVTTRIDPQINFEWDRGQPPDPGLTVPRYSVRWKGILIVPDSGASYLGFRADDGVQIYLDGQLVLSFDRPSRAIMDKRVTSGQHRLQIEYRNIRAQGHAVLFWKLPDKDEEPVPVSALFNVIDEGKRGPD